MEKLSLKIATRDFGTIEIEEDYIINFPEGLFAFEELKKFVLISPLGENTYPMWLQSAESEKPCFIVYNPFDILKDYSPVLSENDKKAIEFSEGDNIVYFTIAVVPSDYKKTTVNLKSPIVINMTKKIAAQIILENDYKIQFPIFDKKGEK